MILALPRYTLIQILTVYDKHLINSLYKKGKMKAILILKFE